MKVQKRSTGLESMSDSPGRLAPMESNRVTARAGSLNERLRVPEQLDFPGSHLGMSWALLTGDDFADVVALDERCRPHDRGSELRRPEVIAPMLGLAPTEHRYEVLGGRDSHGELRAVGSVALLAGVDSELVTYLEAFIDPTWRGRGIGRALIDWQDGRARQLIFDDGRDLPVSIESRVVAHLTERRRLLAAAGFSPSRTIDYLVRTVEVADTSKGVIEAKLSAADVALIPYDRALSEDIRTVYNRSQSLSLGGRLMPSKDFARIGDEIDPTISYVAVTRGEKIVVGFLLARREERESGLESWIEFLAIERGWRNQGIADALMDRHLTDCHAHGIRVTGTSIDTRFNGASGSWLSRWDFFPRSSDIVYAIEM